MSFPSPNTAHLAPVFLMCRPTYYTIAYEINPWMSVKHQAHRQRALQQWQQLCAVLTRKLGVRIQLLKPRPRLPDLTFTANAGLIVGRTLIRSNFRYPQRQQEEPIIEQHFTQAGFRIVRLNPRYDFEGEGDALWLGQTLVFGFRFRSDAPVHEELTRLVRMRVLPVELIDKRFYHLDTCCCPLDAKTVLWYPGAFDVYGRKVIEGTAGVCISVDERDAMRFACNTIVVGKSLVIQTGLSQQLQRRLTRRGFRLYPVDLSEFHKAGGSAKCLVLQLQRSAH